MRSGVLDLGSQTFHALVAEGDAVGVRRVVFDRKVFARIGEHAFAERRIPAAACARGLEAVGELINSARPRAPEQFRVLATGVFREADNGEAFLARACERFGVAIELLDGREEARLEWLGVSAELAGSHGRLATLGVGGGSLQLCAGTDGPDLAFSLPLGVLRLRGLSAPAIRDVVTAAACPALDDLRASAPDTVVITAGTARTLLGLARRLGLVSDLMRHVCARSFCELARRLAPLSQDALATLGVPPARRDTIAAGAIAFATMLEQLGKPVVYVARSGFREGALIDQARSQPRRHSPRAALPRMQVLPRAG